MFLVGTDSMEASHYISEHDKKIANKLAYVMAGGDLSEPTWVTEQYLLDLRTRSFLVLVHREENAGTHPTHAQNRETTKKLENENSIYSKRI